jgi:hypothetical protein
MAKLNTFVHVHDEDGVSHAFGPDETVPDWAVERITNPDVWAEKPEDADEDGDEIPEGDVTEAWTVKQLKAYAKAENIDLGDAKNKAEILAKLAG